MSKFCRICHNTDCCNRGRDITFGEEFKCNYIPVPTKADRIRAMTDEELARQFAQYEYSVAREILAHFGIDIATMDYDAEVAAKDLLEQLQQPAEGDA